MKVTLRQRKKGGKTSLYLDYYHKGIRKVEYLRLYLDETNPSKEQKELNKKTLQLAESIKAQRQIEIQNGAFGFRDTEKLNASFLAYFEILANKRFDSQGNYGNWDSTLKHLKNFAPNGITFGQLDVQLVQDFREYLDKGKITKGGAKLSQNSKHSYFAKFKAAIKQAYKDEYLLTNPAERVDGIKEGEPEREFLTLEELQSVVDVDCDIPILKTAFIFSCLTGLRWSDIEKLTWTEVQHSNELGWYIRFRQKKTKGAETLPISEQARQLLGDNEEREERVFPHLKYSAWHNLKLQQWIMKAGISKTITFHCARHTYATLQLTLGTDIYTVSKLLGHKELRTTQIYGKVIDKKKIDAANIINIKI